MPFGIDVSHYQGSIDWTAVRNNKRAADAAAPGVCFCYIKATEGPTIADRTYSTNMARSLAAGLYAGAYHYFLPQDDPAQQAKAFVKVVGNIDVNMLAPAVDIEVTGGMPANVIAQRLQTYMDAVAQALGVIPTIYTGAWFWNPVLGVLSSQFDTNFAWISHYTDAATPDVPTNLDKWALWQFSDRGIVEGVAGPCDLIRFRNGAEPDGMDEFMHLVAA